jgi:hypothetical protein
MPPIQISPKAFLILYDAKNAGIVHYKKKTIKRARLSRGRLRNRWRMHLRIQDDQNCPKITVIASDDIARLTKFMV